MEALSPHDEHDQRRPLDGVRVLDLTRLLPGAMCTLMLADFGADVIKVEQPEIGDYWRSEEPKAGPFGARFTAFNRNKRSLTLDLKVPQGRQAFLRLSASADILIEGFRPGVMDRLGLGWPVLKARNPRLVFCALSGFGQDGPWHARAGHDVNYLGLTGALELTGDPGSPPPVLGLPVGDIGAGSLMAFAAITLALRQREQTGQGCAIDTSIYDGLLFWQGMQAAQLFAGAPPRRGRDLTLGGGAWYRSYGTKDDGWMVVGAYEPKFWRSFCAVMGTPEFIDDQWADEPRQRAMMARFEAIFRTRTRAEWEAAFAAADCCVTPSFDLAEALASEHAAARGVVRRGRDGNCEIAYLANPLRLEGVETMPFAPAPALGQDSEAVLAEAGFSADEIAALRAAGGI
ncbi:MAG: CoA transferase [Variibacter sp.]|nr:CoA transferase [Variibacter sp.]